MDRTVLFYFICGFGDEKKRYSSEIVINCENEDKSVKTIFFISLSVI